MPITWTMTSNVAAMRRAIPAARRRALVKLGKEAVDTARPLAREETSAMKQGFYYSTDGASSYGEARAKASLLRPEAEPVDEHKPDDDMEVIVGGAMPYTLYNELGTVHMNAQPALIPGVEQAASHLDDAAQDVLHEVLG